MTRHMIGSNRAGILIVPQNPNNLEKIHLAFIRKHLVEIVKPALNISHMDIVDFSSLGQVFDNREDFLARIFQPLRQRSQTNLKPVVGTFKKRFVAFDTVENRRGIPVLHSLVAEGQPGRIVRMASHFHIVLAGYRNNFLQEIVEAFPIFVRIDLPGFSYTQIAPVFLKFKTQIGNSAAAGLLSVTPDGNHSPMIGHNLYAYAGGFSDILLDRFDHPIAIQALFHSDIIVFHSYGFEHNAMFVAHVFPPLHFIQIPRAVPRSFSYGQMLYAVAHIVLHVRLCRHIGLFSTHDTVVVSTDMHLCIFSPNACRFRCS